MVDPCSKPRGMGSDQVLAASSGGVPTSPASQTSWEEEAVLVCAGWLAVWPRFVSSSAQT